MSYPDYWYNRTQTPYWQVVLVYWYCDFGFRTTLAGPVSNRLDHPVEIDRDGRQSGSLNRIVVDNYSSTIRASVLAMVMVALVALAVTRPAKLLGVLATLATIVRCLCQAIVRSIDGYINAGRQGWDDDHSRGTKAGVIDTCRFSSTNISQMTVVGASTGLLNWIRKAAEALRYGRRSACHADCRLVQIRDRYGCSLATGGHNLNRLVTRGN